MNLMNMVLEYAILSGLYVLDMCNYMALDEK